jgi:3',5'-cyclic AMP phosphodiesterase CpdA
VASTSSKSALRVAHISDIHVLELAGTPLRKYLGKRVTGVVNLVGPRRGAHPPRVAKALAEAVTAQNVDHVLVTGDLTNLSLQSEMTAARTFIESLGGPDRVTVIPGNHDVYTDGALRDGRFERCFGAYMADPGDPDAITRAQQAGRSHYPFARDIAPHVRVYGLSSAVPMPPLIACGRVGEVQVERLRALVADEPSEVRVRLVLVHHNLHRKAGLSDRTTRLLDRQLLIETLRDIGATLVLHGHTHTPSQHHVTGRHDGAHIAVIGSGSSTWHMPSRDKFGHFNVIEIGESGVDAVASHRWDPQETRFVAEHDDLLARACRSVLPE